MTTPRGTSWFGRHPVLTGVLALVTIWALATSGSADDHPTTEETEQSTALPGTSAAASGDGEVDDARADETSAPARKKQRNFRVVFVVDGDTVELGNGETVRLAGIDTPEVGQCGYKRARNRLIELVLDRRVTLGASDEDRDQYGRLLRYVDVNGKDAGLRLIKEGLAVARYDSRDGYGFHPREPKYIKADRASSPFTCAKPVPLVSSAKPKKSCAPGYSPCIRPYPPDLDCPDIGHPVTVTGSDPHALDRDGDGLACEWS